MAIKDGGPAFPADVEDFQQRAGGGMSLRDYFAAAALQGLLARDDEHPETTMADWAKDAFRFADAMLAERTNDRGHDVSGKG